MEITMLRPSSSRWGLLVPLEGLFAAHWGLAWDDGKAWDDGTTWRPRVLAVSSRKLEHGCRGPIEAPFKKYRGIQLTYSATWNMDVGFF